MLYHQEKTYIILTFISIQSFTQLFKPNIVEHTLDINKSAFPEQVSNKTDIPSSGTSSKISS